MSTPPAARISSASRSRLILFPAITGTAAIAAVVAAVPVIERPSSALPPTARKRQPERRPEPSGTADSCHPTPMFNASTPAATSAAANAPTSFQGRDSGISSAPVIRKRTGNSSPTASRTAAATSTPKRIRRSASPPHESSRRFVTGERNWSTR